MLKQVQHDNKMKIKVCGMRDSENIQELIQLAPDYIGFIFYDKSKRAVVQFPNVEVPNTIKKVGVFVNKTADELIEMVKKHQLDAVQLHGNESVEYCKLLKDSLCYSAHDEDFTITDDAMLKQVQHGAPIEIIKAFSVDKYFDFEITKAYEPFCDLFLFDTKGENYGGNGVKYDWSLLQKYHGDTSFLLSGGITERDVQALEEFNHKRCLGVDLNSGFEDAPAFKNIEKLRRFIKEIKK